MSLLHLSDYTKHNIIMDKAVNIEGGYSNNPNDAGGETNLGITKATATKYHDALVSQFFWDGDMHHLSAPMAEYIYGKEYWDRMYLDAILPVSPLLADLLFEIGINTGPPVPAEWFQTCLNVLNKQGSLYADIVVDGKIGKGTLAALKSCLMTHPQSGLPNLLFMISALQGAFYINLAGNIPKDETFMDGWDNRVRNQYGVYLQVLANH